MKIFMSLLFLIVFTTVSCSGAKYHRKDWLHWQRVQGCQNMRSFILQERSLVPVGFKARNDGKKCSVLTGEWQDYYYPEIHKSADQVDIDHLVPLRHAHDAGGSHWDKAKKKQFANDPKNLVITQRSYNRKKGSKTPLEWMPSHRGYACRYMTDWLAVKEKYQLKVSQEERNFYQQLKVDGKCPEI